MKSARYLVACMLLWMGLYSPVLAANLTNTNSLTYDTASPKFGTADLNGGYGYSAAILPSNGYATVEAWGKISANGGAIKVLIGQQSWGWIGVAGNGTATAHFGAGGSDAVITTSVDVLDGAWHHYALVVRADGATFYLDGNGYSSSTAPASVNMDASAYNSTGVALKTFQVAGFEWPGAIDEVAIFSGARYTANFTVPSSAYVGTETNLLALYHLDSSAVDVVSSSGGATPTIAPNNAAIHYTPGNWDVTPDRALSINAGAEFRTLFTGSTCALNFDVSTMQAPISVVTYRIDGFGPWQTASAASSITCVMPSDTAAYQAHLLEFRIKSTSETIDRWGGNATAIKFTGLSLSSGATVSLPGFPADVDMIFGDSITEAVRTENSTAANDTDRNDAGQGWSLALGRYLGSEIVNVGFGRQGWLVTGNGNVPVLATSALSVWSGKTRTFPSNLRSVIVNMGTNDGGSNVTAPVTTFLNNILPLIPSTTKIIMLRPFNGSGAAYIQAGIAASTAASRTTYIDTTGVFTAGNSSDGLHPFGFENLGHIAPSLAALIKPVLAGGTGSSSSGKRSFVPTFH